MFDDTEHNPFERATSERVLLTIVLHTASFEKGILGDDPMVERLLDLATPNRIRVVCTPTSNEAVVRRLRQRYRVELGEYEADDEWLVIKTPLPAPVRHRLRYLGDPHRPAEPGSRVTVLDELFTNPLPVDLFVAAEDDPFLRRDLRRRAYVSPDAALDLVRVLLMSLASDDGFYYLYRAAKLFPAADLGRVAMNIAKEHGFPPDLGSQIESMHGRIKLILRAADRVAYNALRRPDARAAGECGYHLAYFFMLVTGLFDELARVVSLRHDLGLRERELVLHRGAKDVFYRKIHQLDPDLYQFLTGPTIQPVIRLFYPARNRAQHQFVLKAELMLHPRPARVLAQLPKETLTEVEKLTANGGASWGFVGEGAVCQVDPYLFTLAAVQAVAEVANGVLTRLDWRRYADLLPEAERETKRAYFDTEIGTGWFYRFGSSVPPYY